MTYPIEAGDVVVCIDNFPDEHTPPHLFPMLNRVSIGKMYRVAGLIPTAAGLGLIIAGVPSPRKNGWSARRFKKLPKADMAFTAKVQRISV